MARDEPDGWNAYVSQLQRNGEHELKIERNLNTEWDILARCTCGEFGPYVVNQNTDLITHAHWMHRTGQTGELYRWSLESLGAVWTGRSNDEHAGDGAADLV